MKKFFAILITFSLVLSTMSLTTFAQDDISVKVNGKDIVMDQKPVLVSDRTLVPLRAIFEALGANVTWDDATNTATGVLDQKEVSLQIENTVAKVNGANVSLDVPAKLINDRTMVPVRFISESLGADVGWDDATQTVFVNMKSSNVMTFDNVTSFENKVDFICGGAYPTANVSISNEKDHTTGTGKSIKMADRETRGHRLKLLNCFSASDVGKTFDISAWVYIPDVSTIISMGAFSDSNTDYATQPIYYEHFEIKANTWTQISLKYTHENPIVTMLGFDQKKPDSELAKTIYIDDIEIAAQTSSSTSSDKDIVSDSKNFEDGKYFGIDVLKADGKRPIPLVQDNKKSYDDLIFYDRSFDDDKNNGSNEEKIAKLSGGTVVADEDKLFTYTLAGENKYGTSELVDVSGMPFSKAVRANTTQVPGNAYAFQINMKGLNEEDFKDGDTMLMSLYMRTILANNDSSTGMIQCIVEENGGFYKKSLAADVTNVAGGDWVKVYLPFTAKDNYTRLAIRLGYYVQTVEIGGYEITNYHNNCTVEDLPSSSTNVVYDGKSLFDKDASWRKDAWDRIEKNRKGDIKIIVKDENGDVVPDADVKVDMYESAFQWGTAVNPTIYLDSQDGKIYQKAFNMVFNGAVLENNCKWVTYEKSKDQTIKMVDALEKLNTKYIRGHALMWDRDAYNPTTGVYTENTSTPIELAKAIYQDENLMNQLVENHFKDIETQFNGKFVDWDVLNEAVVNHCMRSKYGDQMVNKWYSWARQYDNNAKLYINETGITGASNDQYRSFIKLLDTMQSNGVDWDGIGIQSHFGNTLQDPENILKMWQSFDKYGKRLKITEFDLEKEIAKDAELEASFVRDYMILTFAQENMDGFYMWGFSCNVYDKNNTIYDSDWNLKESGKQYIDLVYNKWWTNEEGKTSKDGTFNLRGFLGDYTVTARKDGKAVTVDTNVSKNSDNVVVLTIK